MGTPGQKLSESLEKLKELQDRGVIAIKAGMLSRVHRERLADSDFIREGTFTNCRPHCRCIQEYGSGENRR